MTITTIDRRTENQRLDDEKQKLRRPLERLIDWIADQTEFLTEDDALRIVAREVGHDVDMHAMYAAIQALTARNAHPSADPLADPQQKALDAALDELLDATR